MKRLLKFFNGCKKECALAPLFKMLEALLELFVPLVIKKIIDDGIAAGNSAAVIRMCLLLAALALAGLLLSVSAQFFAAKAAVSFTAALRSELFGHIMDFGCPEADALGTSTLITRLSDDAELVQNGVNLTLRLLLRSPFVVFGAVIMAFTVDKPSALVFAGTVPVLAAVVFGIMLGAMPLYKTVRKKLDAVLTSVKEALGGVRVIRAFGLEKTEQREFERLAAEHFYAEKKAGGISALMNPATYILINIAVVALIYTGAVRVDAGALTQGAVVALYNYMAQILTELIKLADLIISISKALTGAGRIADVLDKKSSLTYPERSAEPDPSAPAVRFDRVCARYGGSGENSLDNISFTLKKGESLGVAGATGSGKTTLVNLIPRFYDAYSGCVEIFGNNVKDYSNEALSRLVAVVPQRAVLFSGTIRDNLRWGCENASDEDMYRALEAAQALDIVSPLNGGLDRRVEQRGGNLSGGQRQRLTVARALLKKAPILILDDSSSALDPATDLRMRKAIRELAYSPCVITVSQRSFPVAECDRILVLEDGGAASYGTHGELLEKSPVYAELNALSVKGGAGA